MGFKSSLFEKNKSLLKFKKFEKYQCFLKRSKCSLRRSSPPSPFPTSLIETSASGLAWSVFSLVRTSPYKVLATGLTVARLVQKRKSFHDIYLPFLSCTPLFELSVLMNLNSWLILSTAVDTIRQKSTLSCMHSPFAPLPQYISSSANKLHYGRYANEKCSRLQCPQGIDISANFYSKVSSPTAFYGTGKSEFRVFSK